MHHNLLIHSPVISFFSQSKPHYHEHPCLCLLGHLGRACWVLVSTSPDWPASTFPCPTSRLMLVIVRLRSLCCPDGGQMSLNDVFNLYVSDQWGWNVLITYWSSGLPLLWAAFVSLAGASAGLFVVLVDLWELQFWGCCYLLPVSGLSFHFIYGIFWCARVLHLI